MQKIAFRNASGNTAFFKPDEIKHGTVGSRGH